MRYDGGDGRQRRQVLLRFDNALAAPCIYSLRLSLYSFCFRIILPQLSLPCATDASSSRVQRLAAHCNPGPMPTPPPITPCSIALALKKPYLKTTFPVPVASALRRVTMTRVAVQSAVK